MKIKKNANNNNSNSAPGQYEEIQCEAYNTTNHRQMFTMYEEREIHNNNKSITFHSNIAPTIQCIRKLMIEQMADLFWPQSFKTNECFALERYADRIVACANGIHLLQHNINKPMSGVPGLEIEFFDFTRICNGWTIDSISQNAPQTTSANFVLHLKWLGQYEYLSVV